MEKEKFIEEMNKLKDKCVFIRKSDDYEFEFAKGDGEYNLNQILSFVILENGMIHVNFEVVVKDFELDELPYPFFKVYVDSVEVYNHPVHSYSLVTLYSKNEKISEFIMWHKKV